jgi:hypothetical protein
VATTASKSARTTHDMSNANCGAGKREKGEKKPHTFKICLTDEYRRIIPHQPFHHIFISEATSPTNIIYVYIFVGGVASPMNIWGRSKSTRAPPIFVGAHPKPMNVICIHRFWVPTNIVCIKFIGTDEYIETDE